MFDANRFISDRARAIDASGIRRVFDLGATLKDPINLSIGQPHFDVPEPVKAAAIKAIESGANRYTVTQGSAELRQRIVAQLSEDFPLWRDGLASGDLGVLVTSGVSGGLMLAILACVGPGDEVLVPDPYFVMYRHLVRLAGATPVYVDTYPDFQLTAERIAPHITPRTKMLLFNSPSNPTGVVATQEVCREVAALAQQHNILMLSDEIYDEFCYEKVDRGDGTMRCPSPATYSTDLLLMKGFSKTYGMTGWRLGYVAGPRPIIEQLTKIQQYSFVCAPSMVQAAGVVAMDVDMGAYVDQYRSRRDRVVERLGAVYPLTMPGGAFYAFPQVPPQLDLPASKFVEKAIAWNVLIIPGSVFSNRDTHLRLSYACDEAMLERGLDILVDLAKG